MGRRQQRKSGRGASEPSEDGFWAAAGGFSEQLAEQHASKIVALWELGGDAAALRPARSTSTETEPAAWSADVGSENAATQSPVETAREAGRPDTEAPEEPPSRAEEPRAELDGTAAAAARIPGPASTAAALGPEPQREPSPVETAPVVQAAPGGSPAEAPPAPRAPSAAELDEPSIIVSAALLADAKASGRPKARVAPERRATAEPATPSRSRGRGIVVGAIAAVVLLGGALAVGSMLGGGEDPGASLASRSPRVGAPPADEGPADTGSLALVPPSAAPTVEPQPEIERGEEPPEPAPSPPTEARPSTPVASAPPEPEPGPRPTSARLQVQTVPASAQLTIDGRPVPSPFDGELPFGAHRVEATAEGHRPASRTVRLRGAEAITLTLTPLPPPAPPRERPAAPAREPSIASGVRPALPTSIPRERRAAPRPGARGAGFVTDNPY